MNLKKTNLKSKESVTTNDQLSKIELCNSRWDNFAHVKFAQLSIYRQLSIYGKFQLKTNNAVGNKQAET